jgi:hypothetical protein
MPGAAFATYCIKEDLDEFGRSNLQSGVLLEGGESFVVEVIQGRREFLKIERFTQRILDRYEKRAVAFRREMGECVRKRGFADAAFALHEEEWSREWIEMHSQAQSGQKITGNSGFPGEDFRMLRPQSGSFCVCCYALLLPFPSPSRLMEGR